MPKSRYTLFISSKSIDKPAFFTKYYKADGESYMRMESELKQSLFHNHCEAVRIELYRNGAPPVVIGEIHRGH